MRGVLVSCRVLSDTFIRSVLELLALGATLAVPGTFVGLFSATPRRTACCRRPRTGFVPVRCRVATACRQLRSRDRRNSPSRNDSPQRGGADRGCPWKARDRQGSPHSRTIDSPCRHEDELTSPDRRSDRSVFRIPVPLRRAPPAPRGRRAVCWRVPAIGRIFEP